jgi:long-chain acyl-CoA synthetase
MTETSLPGNVAQLLARRVAQSPMAVAFQHAAPGGGWLALDWAGFQARVSLLRRGLAAAGLRQGDRLALIAPVSLDWELLHHAALSMGVSVVGLDGHDLPERVAAMAELADVAALAVQDQRVLARLAPGRRVGGRSVIALGAAAEGDGHWTLDRLEAHAPQAADPPPAASHHEATVIFTSGTTGAPKGIAYSHGQLCLAIAAISEAFSFVGTGGRLLCWLPLSNLFQRMVNLAAMHNGATTYLLPDPRQVMDRVAEVSPDVFIGVPRLYEKLHQGIEAKLAALPGPQRRLANWAWQTGRLVSRRRQAGQPLPAGLALRHRLADWLVLRRIRAVMGGRLRCMVTGSAPMPRALLEDFDALGWPMLEAYGLSENVLPMAMNRLDSYRLGSVGRPLPDNDIHIGDDGIVRVRGPGVFAGYLGDPPGAGRDADGRYATGDLGKIDADGFLHLTGRMGDLIKTSTGRRVAPAGVEAQLRSVPGIDQAVLLGAGRKLLVALCTCTPEAMQPAAAASLQAALQTTLAAVNPHERPAGVLLSDRAFSIDAGELTPNLKLRRGQIEQGRSAEIERLYRQLERQPADSAPLICVDGAGLPGV